MSRMRVTNGRSTVSGEYREVYVAPPSADLVVPRSSKLGNLEVMEDTVTPRYGKRRSNGEIIMNSMSQAKHSLIAPAESFTLGRRAVKRSDGSLTHQSIQLSSGYNSVSHGIPAFINPEGKSPGDIAIAAGFDGRSDAAELTLARAVADASSSDAMALVTLAELNKTLRVYEEFAKTYVDFDNFTKRSLRGFKNLRDARRAGVKFTLGVAENWLRYRYGFMQLVYDLESFTRAYQNTGKTKRFRCTSTLSGMMDTEYSHVVSPPWSTHQESFTVTKRRRWRVTSGCLVSVSSPTLSGMDTVGASRYLSSLYELIPFSFMLDWFLDVGTRIGAMETYLSRDVLGTWTTIEWSLTHVNSWAVRSLTSFDGISDWYGTGSADSTATEVVEFRARTANPRVSALPQLNVNFNWKRLADAVSILRVLRDRK